MAKDKEEVLAEIRGSFAQGIERYNSGNFAAAETGFVKVLKPLLSKPIMKEIHPETIPAVQEELLGAMYHLGEIYLQGVKILKEKYGECMDHHSKAAAIFQYCAGFAVKYEATIEVKGRVADSDYFLRKAYGVEKAFLVQVPGIETAMETGDADESKEASYYEDYKQRVENYRSDLANIRAATKEMLNDISDLGVEQIADRAASVEEIYQTSSQFFVDHQQEPMSLSVESPTTTAEGRTSNGFIQRLLSECHDQLGNPPQGCDYSIVGLGSLSLGTMTPWSDLEFAVLVNEDRENYREYFRNLTKLLHIKIINLGETMLRSVGIESLNNFRTANEADDWFWDDVIESGFSFDGPAWHACKHPLGRQGGYKVEKKVKNEHGVEVTITESKPDYELILTPQQLAAWQIAPEEQATEGERAEEPIDESHPTFVTDRHLVQSLRSMTLIDGRQVLLDEYRGYFRTYNPPEGRSNELQEHALTILKENIDEFSLKLGDDEEGKLIDVKKDIYRLGDRVVTMLADYYGVLAEQSRPGITVWQAVDVMQAHRKLSSEGAQHLKEALGIAAELRLSTYANNESQSEMMSSYVPAVEHLDAEARHHLLQKTFHIEDTGILHHFYYVMIRLQDLVQGFCDQNQTLSDGAEMVLATDSLYGNSDHNKGMVHARFLEYDKAIDYMELAINEPQMNLQSLQDLLNLYLKTKFVDKAKNIAGKILLIVKDRDQDGSDYADIATACSNLGVAYSGLAEYDSAFICHDKALNIRLALYASTPNHPSIADSYNNLATVYKNKGDYNTAFNYYQKALEIYEVAYASTPYHPKIGLVYNNLGEMYSTRGEYDIAIEYHQRALSIKLAIYASTPNHPDIATSYDGLGSDQLVKGRYDEAALEYQKALQMRMVIYASMPNHPSVADSYNNLANMYYIRGEYDAAIEHHQKALEIKLVAYASMPNHPSVADSYNNLGATYNEKGDNDAAMEQYQRVLEINLAMYATTPNHPDIADSYNNLGGVHYAREEYDAAIDCYQKALAIYETTFAATPNHPLIAASYGNLGAVYADKGEYDTAIECHQRALSICMVVYAATPNHFRIAGCYNNLGATYSKKGDYDAAIEYYGQALEMKLIAHASMPNHPDIADGYSNLGNAYDDKGDYDAAIKYHQKALDVELIAYASTPNHHHILYSQKSLGKAYFCKGEYQTALLYTENGSFLCTNILIQLGNQEFLADNQDRAREYYAQINIPGIESIWEQIGLSPEVFAALQFGSGRTACKIGALPAAINCQLVLLKIDPELQYGNHYHRLACLYAIKGDVEEANLVFLQALERSEAAADLHAEYAQFLILNKDNPVLSDAMGTISEHLYSAITNDVMGELSYGKLDKESVCGVLIDLINSEDLVRVNPKALAYYLLITHPEYIIEGPEAVGRLLETFRELAIELSDEISKTLFANAEALVASGQVVEVVEDQEVIFTADHVEQPQPSAEQTMQATLSGEADDSLGDG